MGEDGDAEAGTISGLVGDVIQYLMLLPLIHCVASPSVLLVAVAALPIPFVAASIGDDIPASTDSSRLLVLLVEESLVP
jgi:hypothetical protein